MGGWDSEKTVMLPPSSIVVLLCYYTVLIVIKLCLLTPAATDECICLVGENRCSSPLRRGKNTKDVARLLLLSAPCGHCCDRSSRSRR